MSKLDVLLKIISIFVRAGFDRCEALS